LISLILKRHWNYLLAGGELLNALTSTQSIVALTVIKIFRGQAISAAGHATMPEFTGSPVAGSPVAADVRRL